MLLVAIIFIVLMLLLHMAFIKPYKEIDKLPGPSMFELVKNFYHYSSHQGIVTYFQTLNQKFGPVVKIWMKPFKPMIITTDMQYVQKFLKSNELHITPLFFKMIFMGNGIASSPDYDIWKKDKQLITKAITRNYIAGKLSIYDEKYNEFLDIIWKNLEKPVDVEAPLHRLMLDIMMHTINDSNVKLTEQEVQDYTKYRKDFFNLLLEQMNTFRMMGFFHKFTNNYKLMQKCKENIINFSRVWLERFKRTSIELREKNNLVYVMLNGGMPEERVVDNINTLIQGGHETTIIPLALGFNELARHPEFQQRILDEIYSILGTGRGTPVTLRDLNQMEYLQAFVKETLRCYLSIPLLDRRTLHETHINGLTIPKDTVVMFNLPNILKSEGNYDDPLVFHPDRFLKENVTAKSQKAFVCFGYGVKICPGKTVAYAAMKLLIVKILREFEICPLEENHKVELISEIFYRSTHGIPVVFKKRSQLS